MKKLCVWILAAVLLAGCSSQSYETRAAPCAAEPVATAGTICIRLPDGVSVPTLSTQTGDRIYIADDYEVCLQTMEGGDISTTLKSCTGYDRSNLTVLETEKDGMKRYDCAWTAAGEGTQTVGRMTVLDDGNFHYVLSVTAPADSAQSMLSAWTELSESFQINIAQ